MEFQWIHVNKIKKMSYLIVGFEYVNKLKKINQIYIMILLWVRQKLLFLYQKKIVLVSRVSGILFTELEVRKSKLNKKNLPSSGT